MYCLARKVYQPSIRISSISRIVPEPFLPHTRPVVTARNPTLSSRSPYYYSTMEKIYTSKAFPPAGPYSQAIRVGSTLYISGQIHADASGSMVEGSIGDKTAACVKNLQAILAEAGGKIENVVKTTVFLDDMAHFAEMNAEYEKWFTHKPARSCVAVKTLPKNSQVEIEAVAVL